MDQVEAIFSHPTVRPGPALRNFADYVRTEPDALVRFGLVAKILLGKLPDVPGDQLGHLEHADLAFAVEYGAKRIVSVDLSSFLFVLQPVLLDIVPQFFCEF